MESVERSIIERLIGDLEAQIIREERKEADYMRIGQAQNAAFFRGRASGFRETLAAIPQ